MEDATSSTVHTEQRRLAAIMFTDMVGFSRQMGADEARMLRLLDIHNQIIQQAVAAHHGAVIKTVGDAFLVDFPSVVNAVQCAQQIHMQFRAHNSEKESSEQIHVRIGIHLGDIVQKNGDVFGDGVNIASRLQALAEPDTICISDAVHRDVAKKLDLGTVVSLGRPKLKNIAERFQIYALLAEPPKGLRQQLHVQRLKFLHRARPVVFVLVFVSVTVVVGLIAARYFPSLFPSTQHPTPSTQAALPLPDKPSIVVLPFTNMSGDPGQDYFSDGITEVLTSDLSRISSLFVIARNSAFTYKGKAANVQDVGKELGVRYVLEGSVQRAGEQVRITAQLIDATTGGHLWTERYDRPLKDIFALQDEIVQRIVTTLKLQIALQEQGYIVRKTTNNLEAYDAFLRGVEFHARSTKEANIQARQMFEKAVELDPLYAEAYVWLGETYYRERANRWSTDPQVLERALALIQKAIVLDDSLPVAHSLLSEVYAQQQQYDQALAEGERAIALDPNNANSYLAQGFVLIFMGKPDEILRMTEQAMRLNPRYPPIYLFQLGWAYRQTGRYAEAVTTTKQFLSRSPNYFAGYLLLADSYVQQWISQQDADAQVLEQAVAAVQRALALNDSDPISHMFMGNVYLWRKQYEQAIAEMERAVALGPDRAEGYAGLAQALSRIGRAGEAIGMAEQALRRKPFLVDGHLTNVGIAYDLAGQPEEAIAPLKQVLTHYPNWLNTHLTLAAVYSELDKDAEARAEAAEVLRLNPKFSLEVHKERTPIKDPAMLERHIAALRKAGLK
jgi:adenylate cyclase